LVVVDMRAVMLGQDDREGRVPRMLTWPVICDDESLDERAVEEEDAPVTMGDEHAPVELGVGHEQRPIEIVGDVLGEGEPGQFGRHVLSSIFLRARSSTAWPRS